MPVTPGGRIGAVLVAAILACSVVVSCDEERPDAPEIGGEGGTAGTAAGVGGGGIRGRAEGGALPGQPGGGNGQGGAKAVSLPSFLRPGSSWEEVDALPDCRTRVAKSAATTWPELVFRDDAPGVARAAVVDGVPAALANSMGSGSRVEAGRLRMTLALEFVEPPYPYAVVTHDLEGGRALAALVEDSCIAFTDGPGSPHVYSIFPKGEPFVQKRAWLNTAGEPELTLVSGTSDLLLRGFDTNHVWGGIVDSIEVLVARSPLAAKLVSVYEVPGILRAPAGAVGLGVWAEGLAEGSRVMGYTPEGGAVQLVSGAWAVAALGASPTKVVWVAGTGSRTTEGSYEDPHFMWCERSARLAACEPQLGAPVPIRSAPSALVTHGDTAAFTGCLTESCSVHVNALSSGTTYRIDPAEGHGLQVVGIDDTFLYLSDFGPAQRGTVLFDGILRYELAKLPVSAVQL